jgi:hypothetical protein
MTRQEAEKKPLMSIKIYLLDISGDNKNLWNKEIIKIANQRTIAAQLDACNDKLIIQFTAYGKAQKVFKAFGHASIGLSHLVSVIKSDTINIPGTTTPVPTIMLKFENHGELQTKTPKIKFIQIFLALAKENLTDEFISNLTNIAKSAPLVSDAGVFNSGFTEEPIKDLECEPQEPQNLLSSVKLPPGMSYLIAGYVFLLATPIIYLTITGSFAYLIQMFAVFGMIIGVILLLIGGILYFRTYEPEK